MDIKKIVSQMTTEEKTRMLSGKDMWHLWDVARLGVPSVMVTDGPHGLRKQVGASDHLGLNAAVTSICFPTAASLASSFNRELVEQVGAALGDECQAEDVAVILGPGANIKRSPLCGRNFEYFSEDPYVSGEMATAHIKGVQSKNVGVSLKHFAVNNQESDRMMVDVEIDERALREIYLAGFEKAVKATKPWTVMCSYNKINGVYSCENKRLLTDILRDEWGFDGYVMTDWGAMDDKIDSIKAGLELQMPGGNPDFDKKVLNALDSGALDMELVDRACERIINITMRYVENHIADAKFDYEGHHALARKVETEGCVLLKNEGVLPIASSRKLALIGKFAEQPSFQGGGSSHINCYKITSAREAFAEYGDVKYAQGYVIDKDETDLTLLDEAMKTAAESEIAIVFAGMPAGFESEGFDRKHINLPDCQNALISAVADAQPNTVVVLHNSSALAMPWLNKVAAVIEAYLGGEAVGGAIYDVITGKVNPSGKLAETFPLRLEDSPAYLNFPGFAHKVNYAEGIYVGYRYYDAKKLDVLFPFGFGLSYTTFEYSNLKISKESMKDCETVEVTFDVKNIGRVFGKEVAQLYVSRKTPGIPRAIRELKGFEKVALMPGETKTVKIALCKRAFAYYNIDISDWHVETGVYGIEIGASSRDIKLEGEISVESTRYIAKPFTLNSSLGDLLGDPVAAPVVMQMLNAFMPKVEGVAEGSDMMGMEKGFQEMINGMPLHSMFGFAPGMVSEAQISALLDGLNKQRGL